MLVIFGTIVGILLLTWAADRFIESSILIAKKCNISSLLIGTILVGFGTALPEFVVSGLAAVRGEASLSLGNVIGSNITNIGLCLGIAALIAPMSIHSRLLKRDYAILFAISVFAGLFFWLGNLTRLDGVILLALLACYLYWMFYADKKGKNIDDAMSREYEAEIPTIKMKLKFAWVWWTVSVVLIFASSEILIQSAVAIAHWFGVSSLVIGLTVVAIGTSLPELVTTMMAARRREHDIAIGNVVGSNIFNLLGVLAMPALLAPGKLPVALLLRDYPIMLFFTALLWIFSVSRPRKGVLGRPTGFIFLLLFIAYLAFTVYTA